MRVKLTGLNSAPQYNDTEGAIVDWDTKNERWKVHLDHDGSRKALKNHNLVIIGGELKESVSAAP